jgi:predicted DNA-binding transcriptional regulator YafY
VSVEDIPSGQKLLVAVMQAMLDSTGMELRYRKYMSEEEELRHIRPYAVKEFAKRWYVVAYSEEAEALRVYAMDRILSLRPTGKRFRMPKGFQVDELFASSYGIYLPEGEEPVLVTLRATPREAAYLRDLPLHPSQTETRENLFVLRVIPNPNLVMELCKHGNRLEVLEPESLRAQVAEELRNALKLYE